MPFYGQVSGAISGGAPFALNGISNPSAGQLTWATDGVGNIGGSSSANRPNNVYFAGSAWGPAALLNTQMRVLGSAIDLTIRQLATAEFGVDGSTEGVDSNNACIRQSVDTATCLINNGLTDQAGGCAHYIIYDTGAALSNNPRTLSVAHSGASSSFNQQMYVDGERVWSHGDLTAAGDTGGLASTNSLTGTSSTNTSGPAPTLRNLPSGATDTSAFVKIRIGTTAYWFQGWLV